MKATPNYAKYNVITLGRERKQHRLAVLVLTAFVGPRPGDDFHACHGELGNTVDTLANLRWDDKEVNYAERRMPKGFANHKTKLSREQCVEIRRRRLSGERALALAAEYGVTNTRVYQLAKSEDFKV